ncbi:MAG: hypothetical protein QOD09_140 [Bradyrhizobium sp.]|jgi:hypothetical protein|nr:hypothetical protein [Bradyrhizobium sp.]
MTLGVPTAFDAQIKSHILAASAQGLAALAAPNRAAIEAKYVIKYTNAQFGGQYPPGPNSASSSGLYISPSPGFTWGAGIYACPVAYPISGGIYGRCGVVAELPPTDKWRLFNAIDRFAASLYVEWVQRQPMFTMLTLTTHSQLANQLLRNAFRSRFEIDAVIFPPDELNPRYTRRKQDRWLAISEWSSPPRRLVTSGPAKRPLSPKLCVILAEEFEPTKSTIGRKTFIGPTPSLAAMTPTPDDVIQAYLNSNLLWVGA